VGGLEGSPVGAVHARDADLVYRRHHYGGEGRYLPIAARTSARPLALDRRAGVLFAVAEPAHRKCSSAGISGIYGSLPGVERRGRGERSAGWVRRFFMSVGTTVNTGNYSADKEG